MASLRKSSNSNSSSRKRYSTVPTILASSVSNSDKKAKLSAQPIREPHRFRDWKPRVHNTGVQRPEACLRCNRAMITCEAPGCHTHKSACPVCDEQVYTENFCINCGFYCDNHRFEHLTMYANVGYICRTCQYAGPPRAPLPTKRDKTVPVYSCAQQHQRDQPLLLRKDCSDRKCECDWSRGRWRTLARCKQCNMECAHCADPTCKATFCAQTGDLFDSIEPFCPLSCGRSIECETCAQRFCTDGGHVTHSTCRCAAMRCAKCNRTQGVCEYCRKVELCSACSTKAGGELMCAKCNGSTEPIGVRLRE